ncbi:hypothetical protein Lbir_1822 [Legionella birminghamensis]|uniref:Uncharacterized protein n=1 Tax=Legionella birminghamensis TaxID=28083 RepID=A0A378I5Q5_9GAMM|nr:hypothetical protein [Legionella birminghamensis]KTC70239.1 hypothetical protein Lbir_1822 [Legionella birminghamensis]STX30353.1 Uncharacterised protein [Legionella birminghamensis]
MKPLKLSQQKSLEKRFETIDRNIQDFLNNPGEGEESEFSQSVAKAVQLIRNLSNPVFIPKPLLALPKYPPSVSAEIVAKLDLYKSWRCRLRIYHMLMPYHPFTMDEISAMPVSEQAALEDYLDDVFTNNEIFRQFNSTMLCHFTKMRQFLKSWRHFNHYEKIACLSSAALGFLLSYILDHTHRLSVQSAFETALKITQQLDSLSPSSAFYPLLIKNNAVNRNVFKLLSRVSPEARSVFFSQEANRNLFDAVEQIAKLPGINNEQLEIIFKSQYLLSRPFFFRLPEFKFLLKSKMPADRLESIFCVPGNDHLPLVFSAAGLECNSRRYWDVSLQFQTDPAVLSFHQQYLLQVKRPPEDRESQLFSSQEFINGWKENFFDMDFMKGCTFAEMKTISKCWEQARDRGIRSVWDKKFEAYMRSQHRHRFMKPSPICAAPKACIETAHQIDSIRNSA